MKMTIKYITALLTVSALLTSCAKEPALEQSDSLPQEEGTRIIAVSFAPQPATKTALGGEDGLTPEFTGQNERVKVYSETGEEEECEVKVYENGETCISTHLRGALTAIYPASVATKDKKGVIGIKIPTAQSGTFADANICKAEIKEDENQMIFHNQTAILRFYVDESIGVLSIQIQGPGSGHIRTNYRIKQPQEGTLADIADGPDKRICYVAIDAGLNAGGLTFTSYTKTQGTVTRTSPASDVILEAGKMYNAFIPYYIKVNVGTEESSVYQKWAYCNLGAFLPEEYGDYYAWGAPELAYTSFVDNVFTFKESAPTSYSCATWTPSNGFHWINCPHTNGNAFNNNYKVFTKYVKKDCASEYGYGGSYDDKTVLEPEDDAASLLLGNAWRMPTKDELTALLTKTSTENIDINTGVLSINGSALIFPAAGNGNGNGTNDVGQRGSYWTSSLYENYSRAAYYLSFGISQGGFIAKNSMNDRYGGCSIRPICNTIVNNLPIEEYSDEGILE